MELGQYTKYLKLLVILPVIAGIMTMADFILPLKTIKTEVVSKRSNYRIKTNSTTYTVNFKGINDQFTEEIYNQLNKSDLVNLKITHFKKQIKEVIKTSDNNTLINDTGESLAILAFGIVYLLTSLVWFKVGNLSNRPAFGVVTIIIISIIDLIKMI